MPTLFAALIVLASCVLQPEAARQPDPAQPLLTVAERSGYKATSRYDEVQAFIAELAARSPRVHVSDIGKTVEGRTIPLVILADPPIITADEAKQSGKLIVLMYGNIHAGEVDGKEALCALMRDIAIPPDGSDSAKLLTNLVLCFVPIYNADGNDKFSTTSRPGQAGPEQGQGQRENAAGLDLNRDFVKLETPETRALVRFMNTWDPAVVVDAHTTNGSYHRYPMTYSGPKNPAGDANVIAFARDRLFPEVARAVDEKAGLKTWYYGNFNADKTRWEDYPDQPRYGTNYVGLRNRLAILTESYSYATYEERVRAQYDFIGACLDFAAANKDEIGKLIKAADAAAAKDPKKDETVAIRSRVTPFDKKVTLLGWVEKQEGGRTVPTDETRDYEVEHYANFVAERTVPRAAAYVIPGGERTAPVIHALQRHGIAVDELREAIEVDAEAYTIDTVTRAVRPFQGHDLLTVDAILRTETRMLEPGAYIVRTAQPLGALATVLLEPAAGDGLTTWNFFDADLSPGSDFPVLRLPRPTPLLTLPAPPLPEDRVPPRPITFDLVFESRRPPSFNGSPTSIREWVDADHFVQNKDGRNYKIHARTGRAEPLESLDTRPIAEALAKLPTIDARTARTIAGRQSSRSNAETPGFFFDHENDLYYCGYDGTGAARLTSTPQPEELASMSPDGAFVAYIRDNDLWVVDVATQTERALTTGGSDLIRNGKADWVYFEEIFGRSWRVYWWSPDSQRIAFMRVDSTPVPSFAIVNNSPSTQVVERAPYPRPGEPNPRAALFVVGVAGGEPRQADLSAYDAESFLITRVGWWPDSARFYAFVQNRTQTWADMLAFNADGAGPTKLFRETTGAWVDPPGAPNFFKDGSFLFQSERSGYKHYYRYSRDGALLGPLTTGDWEARSIASFLEESDTAFINGTRDNPIGSNLYRVALAPPEGGGPVTRLTLGPGSHSVNVNPDGTMFVDSWSTSQSPTKVGLFSATDGSLIRTLDTNPVRALDEYEFPRYELVSIPMSDGFVIEGSILLPPGFDESRKYPVWFMTYAGPQSPTVGDNWGGGRAWDRALAGEGIIVFRADPRSASGKGAVSAWTAYKQLGVSEMKDIDEAIRWLCRRPYVDADRIGMSGHSYGGFMTSYAMTHSTLFAAGIAGAPVTDWRDYDTIYTERFMLTPQENPEGYEATSVVKAAKNLHGRLLLVHGMMDDNVHLSNNTKLIRALQNANKPFEMMLYPDARHGIGGRHYQQLQLDFIRRTIGGAAPTPVEPPTEPPPPAPAPGG